MEFHQGVKWRQGPMLIVVCLLVLGTLSVFHALNHVGLDVPENIFLASVQPASRIQRASEGNKQTTYEPDQTTFSSDKMTFDDSALDAEMANNSFNLSSSLGLNSTQALTTETMVTSTTIIPTTTLPCSERPLRLSSVCTLSDAQQNNYLGKEALLEQVADTFFDTAILDALASRCRNATWCLKYEVDNDLLLGDTQLYMGYCDLDYCLSTIPEDCMTKERRLVISTLRILCDARMRNVSERCILGIKKMTHVALVDQVLLQDNSSRPICSIDGNGSCPESCVPLGQQLQCVWSACSGELEAPIFAGYDQWKWIFRDTMDNATEICGRNNTQCPAFVDSPVLKLKVFQEMLYHIQKTGAAVLAGIVTALVVTIAGFGIILWACAKKVYSYYEYSRDRVEYTEVKSSEEEKEMQPA